MHDCCLSCIHLHRIDVSIWTLQKLILGFKCKSSKEYNILTKWKHGGLHLNKASWITILLDIVIAKCRKKKTPWYSNTLMYRSSAINKTLILKKKWAKTNRFSLLTFFTSMYWILGRFGGFIFIKCNFR